MTQIIAKSTKEVTDTTKHCKLEIDSKIDKNFKENHHFIQNDIMNEVTKHIIDSCNITTNKVNTYVDMQCTGVKDFVAHNHSKICEDNEVIKD